MPRPLALEAGIAYAGITNGMDNWDKFQSAPGGEGSSNAIEGVGKQNVTSNKGNVYDTTPSANHSTTTSTSIKGTPNSSVDILDKNGNIVTRRWFDSNGNQFRDVDFTNHGNSKTHPEWPHQHGPRGGY